MPEIVGSNPQIEKVGDALRSLRGFGSARARVLKEREEITDHGTQSVIIPKDQSKLYALDYRIEISTEEAKSLFYLHKAFRILFPHNFPRIHFSSGVEDGPQYENGVAKRNTGTVRETIFSSNDNNADPKYPFQDVRNFCEALKIPNMLLLDDRKDNLVESQDGGEYYVDRLQTMGLRFLSPEKVEDWMRSHTVVDKKTKEERKYSDEEMEEVVRSIKKAQSYNIPYMAI